MPFKNKNKILSIDNKDCKITECFYKNSNENNYFYNEIEKTIKESTRLILPKYKKEIKIEELKHIRVDKNIIKHKFYPVKLISFSPIDEYVKDDLQVTEIKDFTEDQHLRYETLVCSGVFLRVLI